MHNGIYRLKLRSFKLEGKDEKIQSKDFRQ